MKKGQMSLEMIIGLLILLVVAVVVIRLFLGNIEGINEPEKGV
ncbi:MAG: class III signal peptide-containing protein, partial [Candidatus Aenigmarchaeota archaeon]|nr:class III signal peptide-containing protein [Candidatus Aenigmarchaeota archaeon]